MLTRIVNTGSEPEIPEPEIFIIAEDADSHIGRAAEVCGSVASASYLPSENGRPTFLNFERAYPNQVFTAVIFGDHRSIFSTPPEEHYLNRKICVTGRIENHQGTPQIRVSSSGQIKMHE